MEIISCGGLEYAVVPVIVSDSSLVLTTGEDGTAASPSLPCGNYLLVEIAAPKGYQPLTEVIPVTVVSDAITTQNITFIPNQRGIILPETGGFGTTWLYIIGGVLAVGAGVLLIVRRRMKNMDE